MDIEGGELEFLKQNKRLLNNLKLVIVELHDFIIGEKGVNKCREILSDAGLKQKKVFRISEVWVRK